MGCVSNVAREGQEKGQQRCVRVSRTGGGCQIRAESVLHQGHLQEWLSGLHLSQQGNYGYVRE